MFAVYALFALLSCSVTHTVALQYPNTDAPLPIIYSGYFNDMWYLFNLYVQCTYQDIVPCLKQKLATTINGLVKNNVRVPLLDGVHFVKSTAHDLEIKNNGEARISRSLDAGDLSLPSLLTRGIYDFLTTHVLEVKLPSLSEMTGFYRQARKKPFGKKAAKGLALLAATALGGALSGAFSIAMMTTTVVMPVIIGLIAFMAIVIGKVALVLGGLVGVNTMMDHKQETVHVVTSEGHAAYGMGNKKLSGWNKGNEQTQQAQNIVYSSYIPPDQIHRR